MTRRPLIPIRLRKGAIPFDPYDPPPGVWACRVARLVRNLHTHLTGLAWSYGITGDVELGIEFDPDHETFALQGSVALLIGQGSICFGFRSVAKPGPTIVEFTDFRIHGAAEAAEIADGLRIEAAFLFWGVDA